MFEAHQYFFMLCNLIYRCCPLTTRYTAINTKHSFCVKCCDLFDYLGITVIQSPCGEAEKACAYLNLIGKCDAVISDDSDVFLYGAKVVYRNFSIDKKVVKSLFLSPWYSFFICLRVENLNCLFSSQKSRSKSTGMMTLNPSYITIVKCWSYLP